MISFLGRSRMYPSEKLAPQTNQPIQHADSFDRTPSQNTLRLRRPCRKSGRTLSGTAEIYQYSVLTRRVTLRKLE